MSNKMIDSALATRAPLSVSARLTLFVLANRADDDGDCWPSLDMLAQETGLSRRGVQYAIDELSRAELLVCSDGRGRGRGKVFHLSFDRKGADLAPIEAKKDAARAPYRGEKGADLAPIVSVKGANDGNKRCKPQQLKGANDNASGGAIGGNDPKVLDQNKPRETPPTPSPGAAVLPQIHMDRFERFYQCYPKHRARGAALKWWTRNKPDEALLLAMLSALGRARASPDWQKQKGRFVPQPATWLNNLGWLDEMETSTDERSDEPISSNGHGRFTAFVSNGAASGSRSGVQSQS